MTAQMDLAASRNIAWAPTVDLFYDGPDLPVTGASVRMEIRLYPGAPGSPIHAVAAVPFQDLAPFDEDPRRRLRLLPGISKAALTLFPTGLNKPEAGEADAYAYDIIVTYADALQDKLALGRFILEPGVTLP